ncbi:MAG: DUF4864 domain-containing protein [Stappiaceae bacterium]
MAMFAKMMTAALALMLVMAGAKAEDGALEANRGSIVSVIDDQLRAFKSDDAAKAFSHAAPNIRQLFSNPTTFMNMVRQGYQPVYRPRSYSFEELRMTQQGPAMRVQIVDDKGKVWSAIYTLEQQPDGEWLITGCFLKEAPELQT